MPLSCRCPICQSAFTYQQQHAGKTVACPHCRKQVQLPGTPVPPSLVVHCATCRAACKVAENQRGKQVSCPQCRQPILVPAKSTSPIKAVPQSAMPARPSPAGIQPIPSGASSAPRLLPQPAGSGFLKKIPKPWLIGGIAAAVGFCLLFVVAAVIGTVLLIRNSGTQTQTADRDNSGGTRRPKTPAQPAPKNPQGQLDPVTLQRVKDATVYLRVDVGGGEISEGSGFFAAEKGLVFTNAHVLGMLKSKRSPVKVDVVYHSGETDSRTYRGEILGVDRGADLAVLRVKGDDLPPPLHVLSALTLRELDPVYVFGFPFGKQLGANITVSPSSVSSLRKEGGVLKKVQVNGGMNPGNSGGPVVNSNGDVVGVAVSIIMGTQINFAVPGDSVHDILAGRVESPIIGRIRKNNDGSRIVPLGVKVIDPMKKIRRVGILHWTGLRGAPRLASRVEPAPVAGDSPPQTVELSYISNSAAASGTVTLAAAPAGQVHWLRPYFVNDVGEKFWGGAEILSFDTSGSGGTTVLTRNGRLSRSSQSERGKYFDVHTVRLQAGNIYTIDLRSSQFDPYLIIVDDLGKVEFDDDSGGNLNARLTIRPVRTATYRVVATTYAPNRFGMYTLQVRRN